MNAIVRFKSIAHVHLLCDFLNKCLPLALATFRPKHTYNNGGFLVNRATFP